MQAPVDSSEVQLIEKVASDMVIDAAFRWVCDSSRGYSHNSDVWDLRRHWSEFKPNVIDLRRFA
jgi:hypothetical protein